MARAGQAYQRPAAVAPVPITLDGSLLMIAQHRAEVPQEIFA